MPQPATAPLQRRPLERGLLMNILGIFVKASRTIYLILFSRILGADGFGIYLLAFAVQEFVSKFAILGLNWGGKQLVGSLLANGNEDEVRPTIIRILWITLLFSSLVALGLNRSAAWLAAALGQASLAPPLRIFSIGFPFLCGMYVLVYSFRPRLNMKYEMYVTSIIEPMTVLLLGFALLRRQHNVAMLACAHVAAAFVAFLAAVYFFNRIYPPTTRRGPLSMDWKMLLHGSGSMGGMELIGNLQTRIDLIVLAVFFPPHVIGVYGAAAQIVSVLRKAKAAFDPILMPIAQRYYLQSEQQHMQHEVTRAISWALSIGLGMLGLMVLAPGPLLGIFGSEFSGSIFSSVLIILAIGQFFYMSLGLSEGILAITGHAYITLISAVVLISSEFVLLLLLIPAWGLLGAAIATSIPYIGVTIWRALQSKRLLGIRVVSKPQIRLLLGWSVCLAVALFMRSIGEFTPAINVSVSVLAFAAAYGALLWQLQRAKCHGLLR